MTTAVFIDTLPRMNSFVDPTQRLIVLRLFIAFIAGVIIGFDRERSGKPAGIRTQMLVCVGSALTACISIFLGKYLGVPNTDPARLMAQVVAGVGFLGAGVIIKNGNKVSGVTTAATIWITAAIGISIGSGFYLPALFSVFLVLLLNPMATFQYKYGLKGDYYLLKIKPSDEKKLEKVLAQLGTDVRMRSVVNKQVIATFVSSQQRNERLKQALKKAKIVFELEYSED